MHKRALLSLLVALCVAAPLAEARGRKPQLAPGKYKEWGPDIDSIEIVKPFKAADYEHVVVQTFDTSKAPLPDPKEKWYGTLKMMLSAYPQAFTEAFQKELKSKADVQQSDAPTQASKTLIIRGAVEDLDPGS